MIRIHCDPGDLIGGLVGRPKTPDFDTGKVRRQERDAQREAARKAALDQRSQTGSASTILAGGAGNVGVPTVGGSRLLGGS